MASSPPTNVSAMRSSRSQSNTPRRVTPSRSAGDPMSEDDKDDGDSLPRSQRRRLESRSRSRYRSTSRSRSPSRFQRRRSFNISTSPPAHSKEDAASSRGPTPTRLKYELLYTIGGHKSAVSAVKFSPDGTKIASCSGDKTIKIWDAGTGAHEHTFEGHLAGVSMIAWSPDSRWVASASDDKLIRLWDVTLGKPHYYPFVGHSNYVDSLAFSPKGNILASGSHDEAVFVWDVRGVKGIRSLPAHSDPVGGVDFTYDGTLIASCSSDGLIRLWDTATGQCLRTLIHEDHAPVMSVKFSPNGKFILAWTLDSALRLWNYVDGICVKTYQGHMNKSYGLCGSFGTYHKYSRAYDETPAAMIVSGSEDGTIWFWDVGSKAVLQKITSAHQGVIFGTDTHPDGNLIVSCGEDKLVKVWRLGEDLNAGAEPEFNISTPTDVMQDSETQTPAELMDVDDAVQVKPEQI